MSKMLDNFFLIFFSSVKVIFSFILKSVFLNREFDLDGNGVMINKINKYFKLLNNIVSLFYFIYKIIKKIIKLR